MSGPEAELQDRARLAFVRGRAGGVRGRVAEADDHLAEAIALFQEAGDELGVAEAKSSRANTLRQAGDVGQAVRLGREAVEVFERRGAGAQLGVALLNLGVASHVAGDLEAARAYYERSLREATGPARRSIENLALNNLGMLLSNLGEFGPAADALRQSAERKQAAGDRRGALVSHYNLAHVYQNQGRWAEARELCETALPVAREFGDPTSEGFVLYFLGLAEQHDGKLAAAEARLRESLEVRRRAGDRYYLAESLRALAEVALDAGAWDEAEGHVAEAMALAEETASPLHRERTLELRFRLRKAQGDAPAALADLEASVALRQQMRTEEAQRKLTRTTAFFEAELARRDAEIARVRNVELARALREAEERGAELAEANRLKNELLALLAHDLRAPLATLPELAEFLVGNDGLGPEVRGSLEHLAAKGRRALGILNRLLELARLESGEIRVELVAFDLAISVRAIATAVRGDAAAKGQTLRVEVPAGPWCVLADPTITEGILFNLLTNAVKYTPAGGAVTLALARAESGLAAMVRDTGQGLTEADLARLFRPFQRLSARPTGGESSLGLGLYLAQWLAHHQGGRITAESPGPGGGATFTLHLREAPTPGA